MKKKKNSYNGQSVGRFTIIIMIIILRCVGNFFHYSEFHDIKREDLTIYPPYCKQQSFLTHMIVHTEHTLTLFIGTQMTIDHANQACYWQKNC